MKQFEHKMKHHGHNSKRHRESKVIMGLFFILFGSVFLMERSGVEIAEWVLSWKTILIAVGIVTLYRHNFTNFSGYVLIGVGGTFILNDLYPELIDTRLIAPIMFIIIGLFIIGKATNMFGSKKKYSACNFR